MSAQSCHAAGLCFMTEHHAGIPQAIDAATPSTSRQRWTDTLIAASPSVLLLRDGELVLYRRTRSLLYQYRVKLADGKWHRFSTRRASLENAIAAACDIHDEARHRQRLGSAHRTHTFAQIAAITLAFPKPLGNFYTKNQILMKIASLLKT